MHTPSKILNSLILVILSFGTVSAAEPANNLNKPLAQIQREFPDCIFGMNPDAENIINLPGKVFL